jgi:hypothetical protein
MPNRVLSTAFACLLLASLAGLLSAAEDQSAAAYVEALYAAEWPGKGARYSPRIEALWAACEKKAEAAEEPCMDFDFFIMGQDYVLSDLKIEPQKDDDKTAKVRVSFDNQGRDIVLLFDLIRDTKGWMIEEMTAECETLSGALEHKEPAC